MRSRKIMSTYNRFDSKLLFRIDFRPTLKYFDEIYRTASTLEGEYEHWKASHNPSFAVLFDKGAKKSLTVTGRSISFSTKADSLFDDPHEEISKLLILLLANNNVTEVERIGVRRRSIRSTNKSYQQFCDAFFRSFYGSQEELTETLADKIDDVVLILEGIKDGAHTRNQFGPLKPEQVNGLYGVEEFEEAADVTLEENRTSVMADTDTYSLTDNNLDDAIARLENIINLNRKMHDSTWGLIERKV